MRKSTVALIGAGQRGLYVYSDYINRHKDEVELVAVAEPNQERREFVTTLHNISPENVYNDWKELLDQEKLADAVIIATNDDMHFELVKKALEKGYHILVEKPMSNDLEEIKTMGELGLKYSDRIFAVAHVLRYTPFFESIKNVVDSGEIGDLISIQHNENIGYHHMAHSFVRGNWRNAEETSPLILAKSCHDMDILLYLVSSKGDKIASFGSLKHFCKKNMPQEAANRCLDCQLQDTCPYSAKKIYLKDVTSWPANIITEDHTKEGVMEALKEGQYGKCVYNTDNTVVDHQVTIIEFENGVSATFNLSAFTHETSRTIKLMGTHGEIRGHMEKNEVEVYDFSSGDKRMIDTHPEVTGHVGHGGGDDGLMDEFISNVRNFNTDNKKEKLKTSAEVSVESHKMALAAEHSRTTGKVVIMKEWA